MAPTRDSGGRLGPAIANGCDNCVGALTTGGGRLEGEKIGRSLVLLKEASGILHGGLPSLGCVVLLAETSAPGLSART